MAIPRNMVFEIIDSCNDHIVSTIKESIENVFAPLLARNNDEDTVATFVEICKSTFCYVETEHKLDVSLGKAGLLSPLKKFLIGAVDNQKNDTEER